MEHKIKKIKDFLKDGPVQFNVIERREKGKTMEFAVSSASEDLKFDYEETLFPPLNEGIISIVKRISDDKLLRQGDIVEIDKIGNVFIIEFNENLVHCSVVGLSEQEPTNIEVNQIITSEEMVLGDYEGIEGEGEDHWPEQDNAIDEW